MISVSRPIMLTGLLGIAFVISQELLYEPYVVPQLSSKLAVPLVWWLLVLTPEFAVCVLAGFSVKNIREGAAFCLLGGFMITTLQWVAGILNEPASHKAIEGGPIHFALQLFIVTFLLSCVLGVVGLVRLGVRRRASVS